jgi:CDP-paratose 2-epimerase
MKVLITGACGFVGSTVAECLMARREGVQVCGVDNLLRPGSETNRSRLRELGVTFIHGDIRMASDVDALPAADWVIDAAANPSVLAGVQGNGSSRQLFEHNLSSLINVLEFCRKHSAGLILLSSSRVYSIPVLTALPLKANEDAFVLDTTAPLPPGVSAEGIGSSFSTAPPISLYGSTKLAAEMVALEYSEAFGFPVWINRCGVLAGAGQFGTPDQGIFSYWLNAHLRRRPLRYIGFDGTGKQVRDAFHPRDLAALLERQMLCARTGGRRIYVAGGGALNARSLAQLTAWCDDRFGTYAPVVDRRERPYDIPWMVMNSEDATRDFDWSPLTPMDDLLDGIARHAEAHPDWLERSGV